MRLLVVGSLALDSIKTPFGEVKNVMGGSASYFSVSSSYFTDVGLVGTIGSDFPPSHVDMLAKKGIDLQGMERAEGKTFRWEGEYGHDFNEAITLDTQLNVFADFHPKIPEIYRRCPYVFLANIDPELQMDVLAQVDNPKLVACDTMNYWIHRKRDSLVEILSEVDMVIINETEVKDLARETNLFVAAQQIISWGPSTLIIKRGEYGAMMINSDEIFMVPAYPLESVHDPTGAGDTFAGGLMGYIAKCGDHSPKIIRQAIVMGSVMASFNVEDFSLKRLIDIEHDEIRSRFSEFKHLVHFENLP